MDTAMIHTQANWQNNLIDLGRYILPSIITLLAGYLGYYYGLAHLRKQKHQEFLEKQLREFYSPMLGCLKKIKAKSIFRDEISKTSGAAWREIVESHSKPFEDHERFFEPFKRIINYDNKQLREQLIPLYDQMLEIFSANLWLANPSTKEWYYEFTKFVEIWHRYLADSLPPEVNEKIGHNEEKLNGFYKDIEDQTNTLRKELSGFTK
jgi:hypothetical protein